MSNLVNKSCANSDKKMPEIGSFMSNVDCWVLFRVDMFWARRITKFETSHSVHVGLPKAVEPNHFRCIWRDFIKQMLNIFHQSSTTTPPESRMIQRTRLRDTKTKGIQNLLYKISSYTSEVVVCNSFRQADVNWMTSFEFRDATRSERVNTK
jgi:hypothetical protein